MTKTTEKKSYIYVCRSPVLNACKIGYHTGSFYSLFKRYQTVLTNKVYFYLFETENPEEHEKIIHRILTPYNISNEIFINNPEDVVMMYNYIIKMTTGCKKLQCYSREKFGYPRSVDKWKYQKNEREEEQKLNDFITDMSCKKKFISSENTEDIKNLTENLNSLNLKDDTQSNIIITNDIIVNDNDIIKDNIIVNDDDIINDDIIVNDDDIIKDNIVVNGDEIVNDNIVDVYIIDECEEFMDISSNPISNEEIEPLTEESIIEEKYIDNPFSRYALKGELYKKLKSRKIKIQ